MFFPMLCFYAFVCALWSPAGKGLTSWLSFVVSGCEFVIFPLYPGIQLRLPCTPRTIFHGCQIVHWDPLNAKRKCPQKNLVWAM